MSVLYVIDAMAIAHWKYHADESYPLADAIANWCESFIVALAPEQAVACFDGKGNWRYDVAPEYKAARRAKPKDEAKIEALREVRPVFERYFSCVSCDGFEADDCVATLAVSAPDGAIVVSSDKDMFSLVCDTIKVYDPRPNKDGEHALYDAEAVRQKLGVPPHRVIDLLSIMGDAADSIPGVSKWGRVAAINAINETRSFAELVRKARAGELKSINKNKQIRVDTDQKIVPFSEQIAELELSRLLVSLRFDAPIGDIDTTVRDPSATQQQSTEAPQP